MGVNVFKNEPFTDFSNPEQKRAMEAALDLVASQLGGEYDLVINGKRISTEGKSVSINPSNKDQVIGHIAKADQAQAEEAMQSALSAFAWWKAVPAKERARVLLRASAIMRRRKHEFSAWLVYEAGKNWGEADADTAEAIDFLEFYAREMVRLAEDQNLTRMEGEDNELSYIPLGVGIVIPPWNFPLAIMAGMTAAAVVSGNTVVLKPATPTPVIAAKFVELLEEAGLPAGVVNFVPGSGAVIGDYLVDHPKTRFISFTGSKEVGVRIYERAAKVHPGQIWLKRVVAEMGGKDALVVDKGVDVKEAAQAIVASAFGFSGQKCSACSRAILHEDIYDEVLAHVVELTKKLTVGPSHEYNIGLGPVVDESAYNNILNYIEIGKGEGRVLAGGGKAEGNGFFIEPTVIADVDRNSRVAQEEIFGPVLAVIKAKDFDDALDIANSTEFGLTGGVFSNDRFNLAKARETFHVGNLYFNRKITGALVGVQPFGGFNMSGTDSKAGGYDYLLQFTQAKVVVERY
ncbi:L-glutamate gamma-semialdehyde dehydrogenase [Tumebacillus algifaecis]|uniref:L-glutamate gamma-semialdehyde dehydrogenase n=1 Tax=Tumebacillus algifaecis TaxID=1214604 RepID=A0A223D0C4_9BACL|nr:L-glutamate gamma-semialdehyde dehydrogenase [Tumebacillus algifaecis]ASS74786.1 L-glutamate gamma-semialdehyde dehydrogenase [Tumebacillus algifaecis]